MGKCINFYDYLRYLFDEAKRSFGYVDSDQYWRHERDNHLSRSDGDVISELSSWKKPPKT